MIQERVVMIVKDGNNGGNIVVAGDAVWGQTAATETAVNEH
jgi:hypothetical protein